MIPKDELLIEFFSEEIPARMQSAARENLKRLLTTKLEQHGLIFSHIDTYTTPRRLTIVAYELPLRQEDHIEEKKGPRVDAPQQAIEGFLQSAGLKSLEGCEQRDTGKGIFFFAIQKIPGRETAKILPQIIDEIIAEFSWPKSMRWASNSRTWVRPLQSILCVFGDKKIEGAISLGKDQIPFSNVTSGHRFMQPQAFQVKNFDDYKLKLASSYVILDQNERRKIIHKNATEIAHQQGLTLKSDDALLDEVTGLVEWPVTLLGSIDPLFMRLPSEVLITSMRVHQKYFALENAEGNLAPNFIVVANIQSVDDGKMIVAGNEKVLRARLSDAAFFYDQDRKKSLSEHAEGLHTTVFHGHLGTMAQKAARISKLADFISVLLNINSHEARHAGLLCKADLMTSMVKEFPELQGIMGYYYALHDGESEDVAFAIQDHYRPRGPQDALPSSLLGQVIALADKLDTLVGFFAIGIKPTGSKDPFALRRAALGCIRLLENFSEVKLPHIMNTAYEMYDHLLENAAFSKKDTLEALQSFFFDRLTIYWRDQGLRHDAITAVLAVAGDTPIAILYQRIRALDGFLNNDTDVAANLLGAYRRACNIVAIEEKKDGIMYTPDVKEDLLIENTEQNLHQALQQNWKDVEACLKRYDFVQAMTKVALLKPIIDTFFENVTVNSEDQDIRSNRLALLCLMRKTLEQVADFSKLGG
ncbi:MAG: glycine--tRNA ligase subunit beta [Alphaproteobacteria bacterium]|nr:glycine--tRNA ligase subunit beta [Alphaproteobacteria bacterium]